MEAPTMASSERCELGRRTPSGTLLRANLSRMSLERSRSCGAAGLINLSPNTNLPAYLSMSSEGVLPLSAVLGIALPSPGSSTRIAHAPNPRTPESAHGHWDSGSPALGSGQTKAGFGLTCVDVPLIAEDPQHDVHLDVLDSSDVVWGFPLHASANEIKRAYWEAGPRTPGRTHTSCRF